MNVTPAAVAQAKATAARKAAPPRGMAAHIAARCPQRDKCTGPGCKVRKH